MLSDPNTWIGAAVGAFVIGFIANRRPQWFAKAVSLTNYADDLANAKIQAVKDYVASQAKK